MYFSRKKSSFVRDAIVRILSIASDAALHFKTTVTINYIVKIYMPSNILGIRLIPPCHYAAVGCANG